MAKFVKGSYATIDEANAAVEELITQGHDRSLLTLITNEETYAKYSDAAHTAVDTEHADDDKSAWEKVKDVFSDASNTDLGYEADEEVLAPYQDDIDNGKIVLLVDDFSSEAGATDFSNSTPLNRSSKDEHIVAKPNDDKPTSIPPILDHEDDMDHKRRSSYYTPDPNSGNNRTPPITEDIVRGDDTEYDYQDEVDYSVDTNLLSDTEENMLPDDTVDPDDLQRE